MPWIYHVFVDICGSPNEFVDQPSNDGLNHHSQWPFLAAGIAMFMAHPRSSQRYTFVVGDSVAAPTWEKHSGTNMTAKWKK